MNNQSYPSFRPKRRALEEEVESLPVSYSLSYNCSNGRHDYLRPDEDASRAIEALTRDRNSGFDGCPGGAHRCGRRKAAAVIRAEAERLPLMRMTARAAQVLRDMETLRACEVYQLNAPRVLASRAVRLAIGSRCPVRPSSLVDMAGGTDVDISGQAAFRPEIAIDGRVTRVLAEQTSAIDPVDSARVLLPRPRRDAPRRGSTAHCPKA